MQELSLVWLKKNNPGLRFNQLDIERIGLFSDPSRLSFVSTKKKKDVFISRLHGKQMITDGPKKKCGDNSGYFDKTFQRIFESEAIVRPKKKKKKTKSSQKVFVPNSSAKKHSTPGDYYGCFSRPQEISLKPAQKLKKNKKRKDGRPFIVGYPGFFSEYPKAMSPKLKKEEKKTVKKKNERKQTPLVLGHYTSDYFTLNPYYRQSMKSIYVQPKSPKETKPSKPSWKIGGPGKLFDDQYEYFSSVMRKSTKTNVELKARERQFKPQSCGFKSYYTTSIIQLNIGFKLNVNNYYNFQPIYFARQRVTECL